MLVADFHVRCSAADRDGDGSLTIGDVTLFLQEAGAGRAGADLAAPLGRFDVADVLAFLQSFGGAADGCSR